MIALPEWFEDRFISQAEIPIQHCEGFYELTIPVHPRILALPLQVRRDKNIACGVLEKIAREYSRALGGLFDESSDEQVGIEFNAQMNCYSFWIEENGLCKELELLNEATPVNIEPEQTYPVPDGILINNKEHIEEPDFLLFSSHKLEEYKHPNSFFDGESDGVITRGVHGFIATQIRSVTRATFLRDVGIAYVNALAKRLLSHEH